MHPLFFSPALVYIPISPGQCRKLGSEGRAEEQDHSLIPSVGQIIETFLSGPCKSRKSGIT